MQHHKVDGSEASGWPRSIISRCGADVWYTYRPLTGRTIEFSE